MVEPIETRIGLDAVRLALEHKRAELGGQAAVAKAAGVSPQFVSDVWTGKRNPTGALLKLIGWERIVIYRKVNP